MTAVITEQIPNMSYRDLWGLVKANISYSKSAAEEIRRRRYNQMLPVINSTRTPQILNLRQKFLYDKLLKYVKSVRNLEVFITDSILDSGWVVYLTGEDDILLESKIKMTSNMIKDDAKEFGHCRLFVIPINKEYAGLKLCFDRGLRCVYPNNEDKP